MSKSSFSSLHIYFGGGNCQHPLPLYRKFCVPLGSPKTQCSAFWAILTNILAILLLSFLSSFFFFIRITYQCLHKVLAKTEHAIIELPPYRSFYMQAWHNTLFCHHFVAHIISKLICEGYFASWTSKSTSKSVVVTVENHCQWKKFCYSCSAHSTFPSTMFIAPIFNPSEWFQVCPLPFYQW